MCYGRAFKLTEPFMSELRIIGITGIPEIVPGDNLAEILLQALLRQRIPLEERDILVVKQKIVSKAEGRLVRLKDVIPSEFARYIAVQTGKDPRHIEVILRETKRIVKMDRGILIVETKQGFVCANAGVDESNIAEEEVVSLLPLDSDASAQRIREYLIQRTGKSLAVIISDTFGRPWREGLVDVALGVCGLKPIRDYKGQKDPYGHLLKATEIAIADELASAAELVLGKTAGIPAALIKGYSYLIENGKGIDLIRPAERDLFR
jgi:coenzyme F420-0:L-glutamate ligase/coenzyme F420-1:gamma-L-glutamate ligase